MSSADYRESLRACLGRYAEASASLANRAAFPQTEIVRGYRQGIIARITQMHALYYARTSGFGQRFESVVAGGLAVFCDRLESRLLRPSGEFAERDMVCGARKRGCRFHRHRRRGQGRGDRPSAMVYRR
jgi:hypothetical protein